MISSLTDGRQDSKTQLEFKQRLAIALGGGTKGLRHLHSLRPPLVHKNFKISNVLVDENFIAKVADVGISPLLQKMKNTSASSQTSMGNVFRDPEIGESRSFSEPSVVYIFGVFLLEIVPYDDTWSILSNARQLLHNIDSSHIKSGNVSIAHLRTYLTIEADWEENITIARAFILFMIGHLWFQTANDTVAPGYLATMNDLDSAAQYDWGSAILASLYHGLDTAVTTRGAITGFKQLLSYWFYEYCRVGHPIVKEEEPWFNSAVSETEDILNSKLLSRKRIPLQVLNGNYEYYLEDRCWRQVTGEVHIPLDLPLSMSPHISPVALHEMRQAGFVHCYMLTDSQRMENLDLFGPSALRAGITPVVVTSTSVHSLSQDFSLPGEAEGPDLGWHMEWTGRLERLPIARSRDPPPMSSSYGIEELWHLTHDYSSIPDPPGLSSSSSDDDFIYNCAAAICVLYQAAVNILVVDATSSYHGSVMGRKDKINKRDHPLGHYNIIRDYFKPNCTYEP
ncbi:hypothetical protein GIB67_006815 [Kingdonia uniflora]|uniref:non-specific serine/threonine protein kinase n=1 Tax=Kingdonia uniflora TaxID=39325 RepID=A0A7J7KZZ5_9MAGN|nr:hypothetical protein GIB67_006815 [Kingdonia uniflora]